MSRFLESLDHVVRRGVRFDYLRVEVQQRFLRGQLKGVAQLRQPPGRQHLFQIRHDVFSADRAENRLLKCATERVLAATQSADAWRLASEQCVRLGEVPRSRDLDADFRMWRSDRNMARYRAVKPWCRLILGDAIPMAVAGDSRGMSLLFPMERLFESHVARWLRHRLAPQAKLTLQARSMSLCEHLGTAMFQLRPDLLLRQGSATWVMDTKWKRLDASARADGYGLSQADFYQMFAYGHTYLTGVGELVLIYPHRAVFGAPLQPFTLPHRPKPSDAAGSPGPAHRLWVLPFDIEDDETGLMTPADMALPLLNKGIHEARVH